MPGRKLIFIDSCYSGGVHNERLAEQIKNTSTAIFASSQKEEISWEGTSAVGLGIFTESLLSGMHGQAAVNNEIRLKDLESYIESKVKNRTLGSQNPYIYIPDGLNNFIITKL